MGPLAEDAHKKQVGVVSSSWEKCDKYFFQTDWKYIAKTVHLPLLEGGIIWHYYNEIHITVFGLNFNWIALYTLEPKPWNVTFICLCLNMVGFNYGENQLSI